MTTGHGAPGSPVQPGGFAELMTRWLGEEHPLAETLADIVATAREHVPGCDMVGLTVTSHSHLSTDACTDELVDELDRLQYSLGEGPCVDAAREDELIHIRSTADEPRYPRWAPRAYDRGIGSVLSIHVGSGPTATIGALNLYSTSERAFDSDSIAVAQVFAATAAPAISASRRVDGLTTALHTRHQIGVAQGILMARYGLDEQQAFAFLARTSQNSNVKLRDVARRVIHQLRANDRP